MTLTPREREVVWLVAGHGPRLTGRALGALLGVTRSQAGRLLTAAARKGYLTRDGRAWGTWRVARSP